MKTLVPEQRKIALIGMLALLLFAITQFLAVPGQPGLSLEIESWHSADLVEADSSQAQVYEGDERVGVRLPDASSAAMVLDARGRPRALVLPPSNALADKRDRALEVGAIETADRQLVLPTTTRDGQRIDFVIGPDGRTRVIRLE